MTPTSQTDAPGREEGPHHDRHRHDLVPDPNAHPPGI